MDTMDLLRSFMKRPGYEAEVAVNWVPELEQLFQMKK